MLCIQSRKQSSNQSWCCSWQWRSQPPMALVLKVGVSRLECSSVKEASTQVGDFLLPHFSSFIVDVFQFLPQRKGEDLNCFQQNWSYFSDKDLFWFSSHSFCKSTLILPDLFPACSTSFFCLADFTTWICFDVHCALLCNGDRSPHLPLYGYVSLIYLGLVYS